MTDLEARQSVKIDENEIIENCHEFIIDKDIINNESSFKNSENNIMIDVKIGKVAINKSWGNMLRFCNKEKDDKVKNAVISESNNKNRINNIYTIKHNMNNNITTININNNITTTSNIISKTAINTYNNTNINTKLKTNSKNSLRISNNIKATLNQNYNTPSTPNINSINSTQLPPKFPPKISQASPLNPSESKKVDYSTKESELKVLKIAKINADFLLFLLDDRHTLPVYGASNEFKSEILQAKLYLNINNIKGSERMKNAVYLCLDKYVMVMEFIGEVPKAYKYIIECVDQSNKFYDVFEFKSYLITFGSTNRIELYKKTTTKELILKEENEEILELKQMKESYLMVKIYKKGKNTVNFFDFFYVKLFILEEKYDNFEGIKCTCLGVYRFGDVKLLGNLRDSWFLMVNKSSSKELLQSQPPKNSIENHSRNSSESFQFFNISSFILLEGNLPIKNSTCFLKSGENSFLLGDAEGKVSLFLRSKNGEDFYVMRRIADESVEINVKYKNKYGVVDMLKIKNFLITLRNGGFVIIYKF